MSFNQLLIKQTDSVNHHFTESDFDLSYWRSQENSIALTGGRGASQKIQIGGQFYVLRHYLRGGLIARLLDDQYVWNGLTRTRPFLEQKAIQHALNNKLPVPEVVAYSVQRQGLLYRASIISRFINNEGTLAGYINDHEMLEKQWLELGRVIRSLHSANIYHADLNANNILIDDAGQFYIIDFDKAEIISSLATGFEKNLHRLLRSLKKIQLSNIQQNLPFHFIMDNWKLLLKGYQGEG